MSYIWIEGVIPSGEEFRPSDWAERLSARKATFEGNRMIYSPLLQPTVFRNRKCLMMDVSLEKIDADLYREILNFASTHQLSIHHTCPDDESHVE